MKSNYEEKFKLLQDAVMVTQKERDEAVNRKTGNEKEDKV
jgi:hypothetical protein